MLKNEAKFNFEALNYVDLTYFDLVFIDMQKININDNIFTKSEFLKILGGSFSLSQKFQKLVFLPFSGPNFG